ncbi:DNA-binding HxlR family transcriptional regulator [Streptomyces sp. SLBN-8D4]
MTADLDFLADCRTRLAFDLVANTWNPVVIWALKDGPGRPGELRARIGGISQKVLTETLRRLEFNGLVARRAYGGSPPRVEYELDRPGADVDRADRGVRCLGARSRRRGDGRPGAPRRRYTRDR